jgi:hypothetical protein
LAVESGNGNKKKRRQEAGSSGSRQKKTGFGNRESPNTPVILRSGTEHNRRAATKNLLLDLKLKKKKSRFFGLFKASE